MRMWKYTPMIKGGAKGQLEIPGRVKKSIAEKEEAWFDIQQQIEQLS